MSDNEINLAVARACGLEVRDKLFTGWIDAEPFVLISIAPSGEPELVWSGGGRFNPRNDDAQAIAALERFIGINGKWTIKRKAGSLLIGFTDPVTRKWFQHMAWGEDEHAKLSVATTDAILAAQEKRNA